MNSVALREILEKLVATIETIGSQTAALTASGDPVQAVNEAPAAASTAGDIRGEIGNCELYSTKNAKTCKEAKY